MFKKTRNSFAKLIISLGAIFFFIIFSLMFTISYLSAKKEINQVFKEALSYPNFSSEIYTNDNTQTILIFVDENERPIYEIDSLTNQRYVKFATPTTGNYQWFRTVADMIAVKKTGRFTLQNKRYIFDSLYYPSSNPQQNCVKYIIYDYTSYYNNMINLSISLFLGYFLTFLLLCICGIKIANRVVKPIEETFLKQKELITNASHELKTPITVIHTNLAVLESYKNDTIQNQEKWIQNITEQTQKMNNLVHQMLDLARTDNLIVNEIKESFNFTEMVQKNLLIFESRAFDKNITMQSDIANQIFMEGNKENIEKVISILFDNAVKYCNQNGKITIKLSQTKKEIFFTIANTGKGIKKENISKIFQRFYKEDESYIEENQNSFGLGLSIAKGIVDSYHGNLSVESIENELTTFKLILNKK